MLNYHFEYKYIYYHLRFGHEVLRCCKTCIYLYTVICLPIKRYLRSDIIIHLSIIYILILLIFTECDAIFLQSTLLLFESIYQLSLLKTDIVVKKIQYEILLVRFMRVYLSIHHGSSKKSPILIKRWLLKINVK